MPPELDKIIPVVMANKDLGTLRLIIIVWAAVDKINSDLFVKILEVIIFIISKAFILDGPRKTESIKININNTIKTIMLLKFLVVLI